MKILVVEDDENSYLLYKAIFGKYPVEIIRETDGEQVLNTYKQHKDIKLIIMDIKLPNIDGYEATKKIKELDPTVPIIAVTAFAYPKDKERALDAGCDYYISKPINPHNFIDIISRFVKI